MVESFTYDRAYGTILEHTQSEETFNPYTYTGREYAGHGAQGVDGRACDLYYYRARYYDPTTGSFISEDPIGFFSGDYNWYRYVGNDPVNHRDPTGLYVDPRLKSTGAAACTGDVAMHTYSQEETDKYFDYATMALGGTGVVKHFVAKGLKKLGKEAVRCYKEAVKEFKKGFSVFRKSKGRLKLTDRQTANLKRFEKKLPKGAEKTKIEHLKNGNTVFKAKVPGRVPGSSAVYEKTVDSAGNTVKYIKTTYLPDGGIAHIKQKYP